MTKYKLCLHPCVKQAKCPNLTLAIIFITTISEIIFLLHYRLPSKSADKMVNKQIHLTNYSSLLQIKMCFIKEPFVAKGDFIFIFPHCKPME